MRKEAKILYVYDPDSVPCRNFVETLRKALTGWDITAGTAKLKTRLFEARKYNLVHYFHPPVPRAAGFLRSLAGGIRKVQTILGPPERPEDYKHIIAAQRVVVFSEQEKLAAQRAVPEAVVECIVPCVPLPDMNLLQPSSDVRRHYSTGDKFLVVALSDICSKQDFDNFIYVMREYNRRGEFRLLVPNFRKDKETQLWRERTQVMIDNENLSSITLLNEEVDLHSLIDASDMALYLHRYPNPQFNFSLQVLEAASLGKPVLCYDVSPYNEAFKDFVPTWLCSNTEDVMRQSKNIRAEAPRLEQISTEIARLARYKFSAENIASQYKTVYEGL